MNDPILALPAPEQPKLLPAPQPSSAKPGTRGPRKRLVAIAVLALIVLLLVGWFLHHRQASRARQANEAARDRLPSVNVVDVEASSSTADLRLPGTVTPLTEASLFARSSGYVTMRYVDIGDTVRRGQVLAEIDSPDLDQQVAQARQQRAQARAAVDDAKARVELARVTYDRLRDLVRDQAVAQQQVDQGRQDLDTAQAGVVSGNANVGAAEANLQRLVVLQGYEKLRAPFDGVVTVRNVDVGALVNGSGGNGGGGSDSSTVASSGSSGVMSGGSSATTQTQNTTSGASTELFRIAQADRVRVFVSVPQENAASVEPGSEAKVFVAGFDTPFIGSVTRTARSLDAAARTLLTEVQVGNPRNQLVPGMYAQVGFRSPRRGAPLLIPGEAVIARADGLRVAVIEELRDEDRERLPKRSPPKEDGKDRREGKDGARKGDDKSKSGDGSGDAKGGDSSRSEGDEAQDDDPNHAKRIHLQTVDVGRDYGTEVEITRGLQAGATIVASPGDDVVEGALVMPKRSTKKADGGDEPGADTPPSGNRSPSREAPTKGRK